jgi:glycosyl transferase family 61
MGGRPMGPDEDRGKRSRSRREYGRATVSMFGGPADLDEFHAKLEQTRLDLGHVPQVSERHDAIFLPIEARTTRIIPSVVPSWTATEDVPGASSAPRWGNHLVRHSGGLFLSSGERDPLAPLVRGPYSLFHEDRIDTPPDLTVIDEPTVFLGWYFDHYGHMVIEGMARAYAVAQQPRGTRWLIGTVDPLPPTIKQNIALFAHLGIRAEDVLDPKRCYRITRLYVPEPAYLPQISVTDTFERPFLSIAHRISTGVGKSSRPVFLSRSRLQTAGWHLSDELRVEQCLASFGMRIIHPQELSLEQQVRLMNQHRIFIGLQGSAFYNKIWATSPITCCVMAPYINPNFLLFDALKGGQSHYGQVLAKDASVDEPGIWARTDWGAFADWLSDLGIVTPLQAGILRDETLRERAGDKAARREAIGTRLSARASWDRARRAMRRQTG